MVKIGEQLQYKLSGKLQDGGVVLHSSQVAHVTFYITKLQKVTIDDDAKLVNKEQWKLFSESEKEGIRECIGESHYDYSEGAPTQNEYDNEYDSYEEATQGLEKEITRLEQILEKKRKGLPTPKQLHFLFRHNIPIPPDLTWGQASDTIDECIAQGVQRKRREQSEKFNGFIVGMRVYQYNNPVRGVWHTNKGEITKLTSNNDGVKYAYVKWDDGEKIYYMPASRVDIKTLWKTEASEGQLRAIESKKFFPGDKVLYPPFGVGIVLHAGWSKALVQFQDSAQTLPLTELVLSGSEGEP